MTAFAESKRNIFHAPLNKTIRLLGQQSGYEPVDISIVLLRRRLRPLCAQ